MTSTARVALDHEGHNTMAMIACTRPGVTELTALGGEPKM